MMTLSSPLVDHKPSIKLSSPDNVTCVCRQPQNCHQHRIGLGMLLVIFLALLQFDGAVDVLDHENGPVGHPDEKPPEVGVGVDPGELEVVNVEPEVVGDGGDEAGLAGARRAVQQVPALPRLANPPVVVLPLDEPVEVVHN
ncbi:unnamed protein product [Triticum turgidum subsp. durum]|uniref:Uncharacterized protein n=1 Tax=Triticum turgidum subsp. durum TaxID=4567 RepID=A0A9R0R6T7_TRITD|nr:unnamed protein product [Triticum turgidum subsp. durum]